jgi:hypothetical protein
MFAVPFHREPVQKTIRMQSCSRYCQDPNGAIRLSARLARLSLGFRGISERKHLLQVCEGQFRLWKAVCSCSEREWIRLEREQPL